MREHAAVENTFSPFFYTCLRVHIHFSDCPINKHIRHLIQADFAFLSPATVLHKDNLSLADFILTSQKFYTIVWGVWRLLFPLFVLSFYVHSEIYS